MMRFGYMGPGDYCVAQGNDYLGRVVKTRRLWEAFAGHEGINVRRDFKTRREAGEFLATLVCSDT